jgi:hypothetical protein
MHARGRACDFALQNRSAGMAGIIICLLRIDREATNNNRVLIKFNAAELLILADKLSAPAHFVCSSYLA